MLLTLLLATTLQGPVRPLRPEVLSDRPQLTETGLDIVECFLRICFEPEGERGFCV